MFDALKGTCTDRILLLVALISIVSAWFVIQAHIAAGPAMAEIYHGDTLLASYPLPQAGEAAIELQVEGDLGLSDIVIDEHGARIASSPCSSQRCVLSGSHSHAGDIIACVPNKILITLRGSSASAFDAIVE
ncbi:NusG domain II-containing protein [Mariprofundus ferrooxydans]|nr:NusG domain II-containing protein [Mariprofundus ferrooxydans]